MGKKSNWSSAEDHYLREQLSKNVPLNRIAEGLKRSEDAVYLYCYRHHIALKPRLKRPMMRMLLEIKFGNPDFFHPSKDFFRMTGINQKRWTELAWGYAQPTQDELRRAANTLNFTIDEKFKLMDARQLELFPSEP